MYKNWKNQFTECENYIKHVCAACDSTTTYIDPQGHENWRYHDGYFLCKKCWMKYVMNPVKNQKWIPRMLYYKDQRVYLDCEPRKGICEWCDKKIGDKYVGSRGKVLTVKATLMHHLEYHDEDKLKDTVEICISYHMKHHKTQRFRL